MTDLENFIVAKANQKWFSVFTTILKIFSQKRNINEVDMMSNCGGKKLDDVLEI